MIKILGVFLLVAAIGPETIAQDMTVQQLKLTLAKEASIVKEENNTVEYKLEQTSLFLIYDENADRMRIIAPIIEASKLEPEDLKILLTANFDRALDVKYAIYNDVLWSVFAHPLGALSQNEVIKGLHQVKALVDNYGSSYSSMDVVFGGN